MTDLPRKAPENGTDPDLTAEASPPDFVAFTQTRLPQLDADSVPAVRFKLPALKTAERLGMPFIEQVCPPQVPTYEDSNHFQSAAVLLRRLADSISRWRSELPDEIQPAVIALLQGGVRIEVSTLAQESFHGIRVSGQLDGVPCVVLAHQATIQLLCYPQPVEPPERPRRQIGFVIDGASLEV